MLHQRVDRALRCGIGRERADRGVRRERGQEDDAGAAAEDRQELLHQEEGCADIDGEEIVEILDRGVLDRRRLGDAGIGDQHVEAVTDDGADLLCKLMSAVRSREVGGNRVGAAARLADLGDDRFGFRRAAAVMDQHLSALLGEGKSAGAADTARGAGDESGLA